MAEENGEPKPRLAVLRSAPARKMTVARPKDGSNRRVRRLAKSSIGRRQIDKYGETSNLDELAGILPDVDDDPGIRTLATMVIESPGPRFDMGEADKNLHDEGGEPVEDFEEDEVGGGNDGSGRRDGESRAVLAPRSDRGVVHYSE